MNRIDASLLYRMFKNGTIKLKSNKTKVDALNVFPVPDGDTGTNMSMTINYAFQEISKQEYQSVSELTKTMSKGCLMGARGNSGVILSQIFRGFASASENIEFHDTKSFAKALKESEHTAYKAVLKPVEGTMLTVIKEIANRAIISANETDNFIEFFDDIIDTGNKTLKNTPNLLPILKEAGVVDSGGAGLMYIFSGWSDTIKNADNELFELASEEPIEGSSDNEFLMQAEVYSSDINFTYCTEFILRTHEGAGDVSALLPKYEELGDSLVFVPDDDILKVHIHTDHPGTVFEMALEYGSLLKSKIDNMREQQGHIIEESANVGARKADFNAEFGIEKKNKKYGFISVASGEGIVNIFKDLYVDIVIEGGQTMNPSTQDISEAIDKLDNEYIFILPNNSNIFLSANQAKDLSEKNVYVVPTKSIVHGFTSMIYFDESLTPEENLEAIASVIEEVKSIQVTRSIRDTKIGDVKIKKNDYIGILGGDIVVSDKSLQSATIEAINLAVNNDSSVLSIYYGEEVLDDWANEIVDYFQSKYPDLEIECYAGNQPVYHYYASVE